SLASRCRWPSLRLEGSPRMPDPDCAVGIIEAFARVQPDFGHAVTFYTPLDKTSAGRSGPIRRGVPWRSARRDAMRTSDRHCFHFAVANCARLALIGAVGLRFLVMDD